MTRKILVPLDGSAESEAVLPHVETLASSLNAKVTFFSSVASPRTAVVKPAVTYLRNTGSRSAVASMRSIEVLLGAPSRRIVELASKGGYDFIAMAVRANTPFKKLLHGSVTRKVFSESPLPLLLVPATRKLKNRNGRLEKIVLAHDGTRSSEPILPFVKEVARAAVARLSLLNVVTPGNGEKVPDRVGARNVNRTRKSIERDGFRGDFSILRAPDAASGILRFASAQNVDLIALASRGKRGRIPIAERSVLDDLLRAGRFPILVVSSAIPVPRSYTRRPKLGRGTSRARKRTLKRMIESSPKRKLDPYTMS